MMNRQARPCLMKLDRHLVRLLNRVCLWVVQLATGRSQWSRGLRRRSAAARLLRLWVRIPPGGHGCLSVVSVVVLSGRGLCDELITRPEESYRLWCVVVCDLETSWMRKALPHWGLSRQKKTNSLQQKSWKSGLQIYSSFGLGSQFILIYLHFYVATRSVRNLN